MKQLHEIYVPKTPESETLRKCLHNAVVAAAAGGTLISVLALLAIKDNQNKAEESAEGPQITETDHLES